jgi:hypothetical protein
VHFLKIKHDHRRDDGGLQGVPEQASSHERQITMMGLKGHHGRHHAAPMAHRMPPGVPPVPGAPPPGPIGFAQAEPSQDDMPLGMSSDQPQADQMPGNNGVPPMAGPGPDPNQQKAALIQALMQRQMAMRGLR